MRMILNILAIINAGFTLLIMIFAGIIFIIIALIIAAEEAIAEVVAIIIACVFFVVLLFVYAAITIAWNGFVLYYYNKRGHMFK